MEFATDDNMKTISKEKIKDLTKYPEEADISLDPGNWTPKDLVAAGVPPPPPPPFVSEDN